MNVYLPNPRLPLAYQEVEWIGRGGDTQAYIDTGWVTNYTEGFKVEMGVRIDNSGYRYGLVSNREDQNSVGCFFLEVNSGTVTNNSLRVGSNSSNSTVVDFYTSNSFTVGQFVDVTFTSPGTATLNGTATTGTLYTSANKNLSQYLMIDRSLRRGTFNHGLAISYFRAYSGGVLVRNMVPCYRKSDNVIGMYDLVNSVFYTNAGSGTFSKGSNINMLELKNAYIGEYEKWKPGTDTVAYWELNGNGNDTKNNYGVTTYTTTNYNSDAVIGTAPTYTTTRRGKACANFSGNGILQLPNLPITSNHITVSLWYNKTGTNNGSIFQLKEDTATDSGNWALILTDTSSGVYVDVVMTTYSTGISGQVEYTTSSKAVSANEWHNYVATFNSGTLKFYIDGILFDTKSNSSRPYLRNSSTSPSYIGGGGRHYNGTSYNYINGYLQDVIYENKEWTAEEVSNYYNLTKS